MLKQEAFRSINLPRQNKICCGFKILIFLKLLTSLSSGSMRTQAPSIGWTSPTTLTSQGSSPQGSLSRDRMCTAAERRRGWWLRSGTSATSSGKYTFGCHTIIPVLNLFCLAMRTWGPMFSTTTSCTLTSTWPSSVRACRPSCSPGSLWSQSPSSSSRTRCQLCLPSSALSAPSQVQRKI